MIKLIPIALSLALVAAGFSVNEGMHLLKNSDSGLKTTAASFQEGAGLSTPTDSDLFLSARGNVVSDSNIDMPDAGDANQPFIQR